jgi:RNA polymerase sigma-70 factor (ECF subfamily)
VDDQEAFRKLIVGVRAGDPDAAAQLVRTYEPEIRRVIRLELADARLARLLDSMDVCQSVLGKFFVHAAAGQLELDDPQQVLRLLVTMARNRLRDHARKQRTRRQVAGEGPEGLEGVPGGGPTPSQIVASRELLQAVRDRLAPPDRYLADQRALGRDWADLAAQVGDSPGALRKRLQRALDRILRDLGLDEVDTV